MTSSSPPELAARLDKWLWTVRVFKARAIATEACRAGDVTINDRSAKPGRDIHAGELVGVRLGRITRTLRVVGVPRSRVGAKLVLVYCTDLTPAAEYEKLRADRMQQVSEREPGSGRPTKRERRLIDRLFE